MAIVNIYGDDNNNSLLGRSEDSQGAGHNVFGGGGNDIISGGGTGEHNLFGQLGNDTLTGINGERYDDKLNGGQGADTFIIEGAVGEDTLSYNPVEIEGYTSEDRILFGNFENQSPDLFQTDHHYGSGDSVTTFIFDSESPGIVAIVEGDRFDLPAIGSRSTAALF